MNHTLLLSRQCTTQYQTLLVKEEIKSIKRGSVTENLVQLSANHNVIQTIINNGHYSLIWLVPRTRLNKIFYEENVFFDHIGIRF